MNSTTYSTSASSKTTQETTIENILTSESSSIENTMLTSITEMTEVTSPEGSGFLSIANFDQQLSNELAFPYMDGERLKITQIYQSQLKRKKGSITLTIFLLANIVFPNS